MRTQIGLCDIMRTLKQKLHGNNTNRFLKEKSDRRYEQLVNLQTEFRQIFGRELYEYCDNVGGFNSRVFHEDYFPDKIEGKSYQVLTIEKYGQRAADLIMELINGNIWT